MSVLCQNNRTLRCSVQVKQEKSIRCRNQTAPSFEASHRYHRETLTAAERQHDATRPQTSCYQRCSVFTRTRGSAWRKQRADNLVGKVQYRVISAKTSGTCSWLGGFQLLHQWSHFTSSQLQNVICTARTCRNPPARLPHVQQQPGVAGTRCNTYLHGTILQPLVRAFFWSHSRLLRTWSADVHRYQSTAVRCVSKMQEIGQKVFTWAENHSSQAPSAWSWWGGLGWKLE